MTADKWSAKLASEPNYYITQDFLKKLVAFEMNKTNVKMNKPVYLCLSFLYIRKIAIHEYWYDYLKPKHRKKVRLCYMDTDSFIVYVKSVDIYKDL